MRLDAIAIGNNPPDDINVIIEVPVGGEPIKYEMDKASGTLVVDRFLYTPMRYPGNYGFVPHTLSPDGDPIDVLVCNTRTIVPGAVINCRPVGVLIMEDEGGGDEKVIAVTAVLDFGYEPGREASMARLIGHLIGETHALGRDYLTVSLDHLPALAVALEQHEPQPDTRALRWGLREPAVTRPYTDLRYW